MTHEATKIVEWLVPEFTYRKKNNDWYWWLGVVIVALLVLAVLSKNFLFGFLVLLAGGLLFLFAKKDPIDVRVEVSDAGVRVNNDFYPYNNIESFWVGSNTYDEPILFLHIKRVLIPLVILPIHEEIDPTELRDVFLEYVSEVEHDEPFGHQLSDRIGL